VEDTGRYSVSPSTMPSRMMVSRSGWFTHPLSQSARHGGSAPSFPG
jgi:hypothetical protein